MQKSILVLAAVIAAGTLAQVSPSEARGLRIGFGFGVPVGRSNIADPSILENAERTKQRVLQRQRDAVSGYRRQRDNSAARIRNEKALAEAEARREAAARARAEKAEAARKMQAARPSAQPLPNVAALPAVAVPTSSAGGDRALEQAQEAQRRKADEMLRDLERTAAVPAPAAPRVAVPSVPPASTPVKVTVPVPAEVKAAPSGDCRRFIPGAGITVTVPCSD